MPEETSHLAPHERLRLLNPVPDPPSDAEIDAALQRLLARVPTAEASRRTTRPQVVSRRRIALGSSVAATAAATAFVVANLLPASSTPGVVSDAFAKHVIAHATAALTGAGTGILHIVETTTGATGYVDTFQSWDSQTTPDEVWETNQHGSDDTTGPDTSIQTISGPGGNTIESYEAASNTLQITRFSGRGGIAAPDDGNPAYRAVVAAMEANGYEAARQLLQQSPTFSDLIVALLQAPGITVNPNASVNGAAAISITDNPQGNTSYTFYVQPQTYTPLELTLTMTPTNGSDTAPSTITTTFNTYETLPAGSVSMPDLTRLYPDAKIVSKTF